MTGVDAGQLAGLLTAQLPNQLASVGLALATSPVLLLVHRWLRRHAWGLPAAVVVQAGVWWALCAALWPRTSAGAGFTASDWLAGGCLIGAQALAWMWIYSTLCRGFSLQLMVELEALEVDTQDTGDGGGASLGFLAERYADGRGLGWMLDKRIQGLEAVGLLRRRSGGGTGEILHLTASGRWVERFAGAYKRLVGIGAGG